MNAICCMYPAYGTGQSPNSKNDDSDESGRSGCPLRSKPVNSVKASLKVMGPTAVLIGRFDIKLDKRISDVAYSIQLPPDFKTLDGMAGQSQFTEDKTVILIHEQLFGLWGSQYYTLLQFSINVRYMYITLINKKIFYAFCIKIINL